MQFSFFEIDNFRGIQHVKIDLGSTPESLIYALVGLNESGKTTVLEAINHFTYKNDDTLDPLELPGYSISDVHSLIPIAHQSNFNGDISLKFGLILNQADEDLIKNYMKSELDFNLTEDIKEIVVHQKIPFKDSKHDTTSKANSTWRIKLRGTQGKKRKVTDYKSNEPGWIQVVNYITKMMPSVLYFPNFLFDFPDKIFLEDTATQDQTSEFYRLVLQDILDALNQNLDLKTHVLARAKSTDPIDQQHLEQVLLSMGRNVTDTVFTAWNGIFDQQVKDKKVIIKSAKDEKGRYYLEFKLEDADGYYYINQRSLGFRWFFVFLLLTKYRGDRKDAPNDLLFLFDEPASNLHPSAQTQLLESFKKFPPKCRVIYTTHSHHLINPKWLESIFVVKNEGLDYKSDLSTYSSSKTNISVTKYREFAIKHPDQTDYYRPILDVLDFTPSRFDNIPKVVMLEGKNDFYTLSYMQEYLGGDRINLLPGTSSSNLDPLIRLYISWGANFVVLLDSDKEGRNQRARYEEMFEYLLKNRIFNLADVNSTWGKFEMESLFTDTDKLKIQNSVYGDIEFNKTHFNRAVQELLVNNSSIKLEEETIANFKALIDFIKSKLDENAEH